MRSIFRRLKKGLKFVQYKNVIHLSKAPLQSLRRLDGYAHIGNVKGMGKQLAVLVATGICVGCHLQEPIGAAEFRNKRLLMKLFDQEYQLFESRIATYFQVDSFFGPMDSGTISFQTKKENAQTQKSKLFIFVFLIQFLTILI
jgi:hypothetical protein